ncbi:MAG: ATP-binding protein [Fidelibacterota bacterium]
MDYPRKIEKEILDNLNDKRALFILGSRRVGKTTLLKRIQRQVKNEKTLYFDLENLETLTLFKSGYNAFIAWFEAQGFPETERVILFIDEIQYLDEFSNFVKLAVDHFSHRIKLILSGSSAAQIKYKFRDSLVGRKYVFNLFPLTFREFLHFKHENRIIELLGDNAKTVQHEYIKFFSKALSDYYQEFLIYGGYPEVVLKTSVKEKYSVLNDLINSYVLKDIRNLFHLERIDVFNQLIGLLAIQTGQLFNSQSVSKTIKTDHRTLSKYIQILEDTFMVAKIKPLFTNKKKELKKMPKIYLLDTGVRNMLLKSFQPFPLRTDVGILLENGVFSSLWKNITVLEELYFWRTIDGKEVDFILQRESDFIPFEVKGKRTAVSHLKRFGRLYNSPEMNLVRLDSDTGQPVPGVNIIPPWII